MAFLPVRDNGTFTGTRAIGTETSIASGFFTSATASQCYPNVDLALDQAGEDDIIVVADDHNHTYTTAVTYQGPEYLWTTRGCTIVSVDNTDATTPKAGATEGINTTQNLNFDGWNTWYGFTFDTAYNIVFAGYAVNRFYDCVFKPTEYTYIQDRHNLYLYKCDFTYDASHWRNHIRIQEGSQLRWIGGSWNPHTATELTQRGPLENVGGASIYVSHVDFSALSTACYGRGLYTYRGASDIQLVRCKMPTSFEGQYIYQDDSYTRESYINAHHCTDTASEEPYAFARESKGGLLETTTAAYRDNSVAVAGTQVGLKLVTTVDCVQNSPFWFYLAKHADLSTTSTLTVYFATSESLDTTHFTIHLGYPDGTSVHQGNYASKIDTKRFLYATGSSLTSSSETWSGASAAGLTKYEMSIDVSGIDAGGAGHLDVWVEFTAPSKTVYFCPTLGIS